MAEEAERATSSISSSTAPSTAAPPPQISTSSSSSSASPSVIVSPSLYAPVDDDDHDFERQRFGFNHHARHSFFHRSFQHRRFAPNNHAPRSRFGHGHPHEQCEYERGCLARWHARRAFVSGDDSVLNSRISTIFHRRQPSPDPSPPTAADVASRSCIGRLTTVSQWRSGRR